MKMSTPTTPFHVMTKPIGAQCNLRCDYCFYLEKTALYPEKKSAKHRMSEDVLETLIRSQIQARANGQNEVQFAWQGGEPMLMGIPFFEKAVWATSACGRQCEVAKGRFVEFNYTKVEFSRPAA